jgi:hypothetical protein
MNVIKSPPVPAQTPPTEECNHLDAEMSILARRLRNENDYGPAAGTDHKADEIEKQMEKILNEEMSAAELAGYLTS